MSNVIFTVIVNTFAAAPIVYKTPFINDACDFVAAQIAQGFKVDFFFQTNEDGSTVNLKGDY